jgi:cell division protein ZapA (FtsZ GTPase activity inhibitor)
MENIIQTVTRIFGGAPPPHHPAPTLAQNAMTVKAAFRTRGQLVRIENPRRKATIGNRNGLSEDKLNSGAPIPTTIILKGWAGPLFGDTELNPEWAKYCGVIYGPPTSMKVIAALKKDFGTDRWWELFERKGFLRRLNSAASEEDLENIRGEISAFAENNPQIQGSPPLMNVEEILAKLESRHQRKINDIEDAPIKKDLVEFLTQNNERADLTDTYIETCMMKVKNSTLDDTTKTLFQYALKKLKTRTLDERKRYFDRATGPFPAKYSGVTEETHNEVLVSTTAGIKIIKGIILRICPTALAQAKVMLASLPDQTPLFIYDHKTGDLQSIDSDGTRQDTLLEQIGSAMGPTAEIPSDLKRRTLLHEKIIEYRICQEAEKDFKVMDIKVVQRKANAHPHNEIYKKKIISMLLNHDCRDIRFQRLSILIPEVLDNWEINNKIHLTETLYHLSRNADIQKRIAAVRGALGRLVTLLDSNHPTLRPNALLTLRNLACNADIQKKIAAVPGALDKLVKLLDSTDPIIQRNAVLTLCHLSCNADVQKKIAAVPGALDKLVKLLDSTDPTLQINAVVTLGNLACNADNREEIAAVPGALDKLVKLLDSTDPTLPPHAVVTLRNLACNADNMEEIAAVPGALDKLVQLLDSNHPTLRPNALLTLRNLACNADIQKKIAAVPGALDKLVQLLDSNHPTLPPNALLTLRNLSGNADIQKKIAAVPGALDKLVKLLDSLVKLLDSNHPTLPPNALLTLYNLSGNADNRETIAAVPALFNKLVKLLGSTDPALPRLAVLTLYNLACNANDRERIAAVPGALDKLVQLLNSTDPTLQINAVVTLYNLSCNADDRERIAAVRGAPNKLVKLLDSTDPALRRNALLTLYNLSCNADNRETIAAVPAVFNKLVQLLDSTDPALQINAVVTLCHLACNADNMETIAAVPDALYKLVQLLDSTNNIELQNGCNELLNKLKSCKYPYIRELIYFITKNPKKKIGYRLLWNRMYRKISSETVSFSGGHQRNRI